MSIETTGPERYEFQYHVTLELVLRLWAYNVWAVVDSGGEDSTLKFALDGDRVELELQVKGAEHHSKAVDEKVLREYLAHFPSRQSTGSLLERLLTQPSKLVLLVCTQRAMDFASPLTVRSDWCGKPHRKPPLSAGSAKSFLSHVIASKTVKDTPLERERVDALITLGQNTSATELNNAFKRLFLQENVTKENVVARLFEHLRSLGVSNDRVKATLLKMLQSVRDSKGAGTDVVPALKAVLNTEVTPSVRPNDYVPRGCEKAWIAELTATRALLLSGPPRCGKTDAARWVAGVLQDLGFQVLRTGLVDEAERILLDDRRTEILVVLDDPLGSDLESNSRAGQALRSLDRLVRELRSNRRLIVAQSQEVLLAARFTDVLDKVETGGRPWHDLGKCPPEFLSQVWMMQCQRNQVSSLVESAVGSAIAIGQIDVPAGVLAHVAAYHEQLQGDDVVRQAQSLASESAIEFAMTLRSIGAHQVVRALAIGSTVIETSSDRELAFILGEGAELKTPSRHGYFNISPGKSPRAPTAPPTYAEVPALPDNTRQHLTNLEVHRVLRRNQVEHFEFSHPYYRSAARTLLGRTVSMEKEEVLSAVRRGLFAPSSITSRATARNLWWLHRDLEKSLGLGDSLVELAETGLRWNYPTTRDLCYEFLLEIVKTQPDRYSDRLQSWVNSMSSIRLDDVIWDEGDPFFPVENEQTNQYFLRSIPSPDEARVRQTLVNLRAGDALPDHGDAVELLHFFKPSPHQLESDVLLRLLGFSEGLIRAEAAHIWLLSERGNDDEILARLQRDTHPSVVSRMLDAVIKTWKSVGSDRQEKLAALLRASSTQPEAAAIVVSGLLKHFNDDEWDSDRTLKPWDLVGEVLAPALVCFPGTFRMAGERLYDVCDTALAYLESSSSEAVVNAWIDWLQIRIAAGNLPNDYMLGVATSLLDAPALSAEPRRAAIERLLALPSTGAVLVFVASLVSRWKDLLEAERIMVVGLLSSGRDDDVWMKAAALTQDSVPSDIQTLLLGAPDRFDISAVEFISYLPLALLTACVRVHRGAPQPLWYLGHHHDNSPTWNRVIRELARMPHHPLFEDCIEEIFHYKHRYGANELSDVIIGLDASGRERVFNLILELKMEVNGDWHQREFDLLLELAPSASARAQMIDRMVEKSDLIIEDMEDVNSWSHHTDVQKALEKAFQNDFVIPQIWHDLTNTEALPTLELRSTIAESLTAAVEASPPILPSTHWFVNDCLNALKVGREFHERAESMREKSILDFQERMDPKVNSSTVVLPNWIGPR